VLSVITGAARNDVGSEQINQLTHIKNSVLSFPIRVVFVTAMISGI